jgi:TRAP-type transport system periplasmic protein
MGTAAFHFAAAVSHRSGGQLTIEVYPSGQLAKERESIDGLTTGVVDLALESCSFLVPLFPRFQAFDLPFLFKNNTAAFRTLDGAMGEEFFADLESKGILGLCWGSGDFREIESTTKAIVAPEDMKGLRVRAVGSPVSVATYQALEANPVALDLTETFTALSQHTIDAMDLTIDAFTTGKYYTVGKHIAMSNHVIGLNAFLGSKRKIEALPLALQKIIKEEGKALGPFWRSSASRKLATNLQVLKTNGVAFTEIQYPAFRKAVDPVYAMVQTKLGGDLVSRLVRASNAAGGT